MHRLEAMAQDLRIFHEGERGPQLWLLHGYGSGPLSWHHWLPELSRNFRVHVPNLTPMFSSSVPMSFSTQVEVLAHLVREQNPHREPIFLLGASFGGTLSVGLRKVLADMVRAQIMINPMPLSPVAHVRISQLRAFFGLNMVPGALSLYLRTPPGREMLLELGEVFGFGHHGRRELGGLSPRKLELIARAVQRFIWICQHEDWEKWACEKFSKDSSSLLLCGSQDPLFALDDFLTYRELFPNLEAIEIHGAGHCLERSHAQEAFLVVHEFLLSLEKERELSA